MKNAYKIGLLTFFFFAIITLISIILTCTRNGPEYWNYIHNFLAPKPIFALFFTIALGYFIGKFKIKNFVLGGVAGSLLIGVLIGQFHISINPEVASIFFALFIYAVGYQGGANFFRSLNKKTFVLLISATITCLLGLFTVLVLAKWFNLDRGLAAGIASGGLTQSAIIGTADNAISLLHNVSAHAKQVMQSNVAVGYAVCYIFGSFGPIIMLAAVIPGIMGWDLRKEAKKLASLKTEGTCTLEPGQFEAINKIVTRCYKIHDKSIALKQTISYLHKKYPFISVEKIIRKNKHIIPDNKDSLKLDDILIVTGRVSHLISFSKKIGDEISSPKTINLVEEIRKVVITNKDFNNISIKNINEKSRGVYFSSIIRNNKEIIGNPEAILHCGDELTLIGQTKNINKIASNLGYTIPQNLMTDFIFFGIGMCFGYAFGLISIHIAGVSIALGSGLGCLLSGLIFGWVRSRYKNRAELPVGASNFLRDAGLAVFASTVGIAAGPHALSAIEQYGIEIFFLGCLITLVPIIITFIISYFILKIKNPIEVISAIAGGRSANPAFGVILENAGNDTPIIPFTSTYAVANIWLTLWGPVIVALITLNAS
jgi:putative transport protein